MNQKSAKTFLYSPHHSSLICHCSLLLLCQYLCTLLDCCNQGQQRTMEPRKNGQDWVQLAGSIQFEGQLAFSLHLIFPLCHKVTMTTVQFSGVYAFTMDVRRYEKNQRAPFNQKALKKKPWIKFDLHYST